MRILHVLDHGLPLQSGYSFRTRAIMKAQAAQGWAVAAVTGPRQGDGGPPCTAGVETVDGLDFHRTPAPRRRGAIGEARGLWAFARAIDAAAAAFRPDILHAHSPALDAVAALLAARRRRLPLVYEIRAFWEDAAVGNGTAREGSLRYRATRALEGWAVRRADAVAVICEGLRGDLVARGVDPAGITVSPNGVDLALFGAAPPRDAALAAELGLADADVVGFIGSFYDYEGLDDLIAAMPALVARRPRARLLLVGGGPMAASLRAQAAASPVAGAIRFVGRVPHDEVERYYGLVDILAYPRKAMRLTELVTPLKPLEAMAQRRLVAASDVGGHRELIRDGDTGTLFRPDDPAAVADALAGLFEDRSGWQARRERARAFVERERNWSSNIGRYWPVYQRLCRTRSTSGIWQAIPRLSFLIRTLPTVGGGVAGLAAAGTIALLSADMLEHLVWTSGVAALVPAAQPPLGTTARLLLAGGGGGVAGAVTWAALFLLFGPGGFLAGGPAGAGRPAVRRADAHPDAPPRRPMTAADLGTPLMDVVAPPPVERPLPRDLDQPLAAFHPAAMPLVPREPSRAVPALAPGERIHIFQLTPPPPAPAAAAPRPAKREPASAQSIDTLLRRLEEGAGRRTARLQPNV